MSGSDRLSAIADAERHILEAGPRLREPQRKALRSFVELLKRLPRPLSAASGVEVAEVIRSVTGVLTPPDAPRVEFAMATGTGKTKVIGTLASLLIVAGEADAIVLLGSTRAVVERLRRDLAPDAVDPLFSTAELQLAVRDISDSITGGIPVEVDGPLLAVLTVQGLQASIEAYGAAGLPHPLAGRRIVAFFDEAHHLSDGISGERWSFASAVSGISPSLVVGTTGTPRAGTPVLFEYSLAQSLRDGLYSKVPIIWLEPTWNRTDDEAVLQRLRVGLERLEAKQSALDRFEARSGIQASGTPMMLVCASSVEDARRLRRLLTGTIGLPASEVLSVDTRAEAGLTEALAAGTQRGKIKVVVQVRMLDEGWDVPNIYVILVERAGASWTNARQVMGRGLRLPFGQRIGRSSGGERELDELDVMAFGGSAFERVRDEIRSEFGYAPSQEGAAGIGLRTIADPSASYDVTPTRDLIRLVVDRQLDLPVVAPLWPAVEVAASDLVPEDDVISGLSRPIFGVALTGEDVGLRRMSRPVLGEPEFTEQAAREFARLAPMLDAPRAMELGRDVAAQVRAASSFPARALPARLGQAMADRLVRHWAQQPLEQMLLGKVELARELPLPEALSVARMSGGWMGDTKLYEGWRKSLYDLVRFDVIGEFDTAGALDDSPLVQWWMRNDPYQVAIWWAGGRYFPDLIAEVMDGANTIRIVIEVKRSDEMDGGTSDAALKKRAAVSWCHAASEQDGGCEYRYHMIASEAGAGGLSGILEGLGGR